MTASAPAADPAASPLARPMRLLFVIDSLGAGGAQRQMATLARELSARGHAVELFLYHPAHDYFRGEVDAAGIPVHAVPKRGRLSPGPALALRRRVARGRYDALLSFLPTPNAYALVAALGPGRPPLVVSERSADFGRVGVARRALERAYAFADAVVVNSHHQRQRLARRNPRLAGRMLTIVNGIDLARFRPAPTPGDPDRLLAVGKVQPGKNVLGLVRGMAAYRGRFGQAPPAVSWAGREEGGPALRREADALLAAHGLADRWAWLGEVGDVAPLYAAHGALVHPSFYEGFPNAVCEALASGRPVLASRVCDHPPMVGEGDRGFLFDPEDPGDIAGVLRQWVECGAAERAAMAARARGYAESTLGAAALADAYEGLFARLVAARGRGAGRHGG